MPSNQVRGGNNEIHLINSGGWRISNIGWKGRNSGSSSNTIAVACQNANQTGIIENCYLGDGGGGQGIWVHPSHRGEIIIRNCYFEGFNDNAVYASAPGNHNNHPAPGGGGVVKIENCYSKGSAISNFRIGTDGSYIKNCVSVNPGRGGRGFWGFYNHTRVIDCDILAANAPNGAIAVDTSSWSDGARVTLENTRFTGKKVKHYGGAQIIGNSVGQPRDYYPGVPLSPAAARDGNLTGDPGDGGGRSLDDILTDGENEITVRPE